jgi:hypothetical protein
MVDHPTYRAEPDPEFADRLERVLLQRLTAGPDGTSSSRVVVERVDPARPGANPDHRERDIIMLDTEDRPTGPMAPRRRSPGHWLLLAAAVAVVAAVGAVLVAVGGDDDKPLQPVEEPAGVIAKGSDIELVGDLVGIERTTLNIDVERKDGQVTGDLRVADNLTAIECADTSVDGFVVIAGTAGEGPDVARGDLLALVIREGEPDGVALLSNEANATTCQEMIDSVPDDLFTSQGEAEFTPLEAGSDIETG